MNNFIEINNISYKYDKGKLIFNNFSLNLDNRETTVLIGKNGSGKTTLTKLIMGIIKPQIGDIKINGKNSTDLTLDKQGK